MKTLLKVRDSIAVWAVSSLVFFAIILLILSIGEINNLVGEFLSHFWIMEKLFGNLSYHDTADDISVFLGVSEALGVCPFVVYLDYIFSKKSKN